MRSCCFVSLPAYGYFNPDRFNETGGGGAKRQSYLLATGLSDELAVTCIVGNYGQPPVEEREGVRLIAAYTPNQTPTPKAMLSLASAMLRADADIYVYRGGPRKAAFIGTVANLLGSDWVYNVSNDADLDEHFHDCSPLIQQGFKWAIRQSKTVITQTPNQQAQLLNRFGIESTVIPSGYPPIDESPPTNREFVLWVGRLDREQKRPQKFLDCAARLPEISFRMVGPAPDDGAASRLQQRCDALDNVEYLGPVNPEKIHELFSRAIVLINTSAYEGFPNTFLEAWRCETPVVSLSVDPGRYLEESCYNGYANGSMDSLVDEVSALASDPDWRHSAGQRLRAYVEDAYHIDFITDRYGHVLTDC